MPVGRTKNDKKSKKVKHVIDIDLLKVSTRYILTTETATGDKVVIGAKYNHLDETVNIYPQSGSGFWFKHSDPSIVKSVAHLIEAVTELVEKDNA